MTATDESQPMADPPDVAGKVADGVLPVIRSETLLGGRRELLIAHCDEVYRLRLTRNGKLILTK